jgi:superfamily II DNA or RNA helicase
VIVPYGLCYDPVLVRTVEIVIDSALRVDGNMLGSDLVNEIFDQLVVPNPDWEYYRKRADKGFWVPDIEKEFELGELDGDTVVLPRGFAQELKSVLAENNIRPRWIDRRVWKRGKAYGRDEFHYREHQPQAVRQIIRHQQGVYEAGTGSGKTVVVCGVLWETSPRRSLILVDRINLVDQWIERIDEHIGYNKIGRIGEGEWNEGRITVATVQTLHKHIDALIEDNWFDDWHLVCLDEVHHGSAATINALIQRFPARIRFGVSATPDKTGDFRLIRYGIGEIFHQTNTDQLREAGVLVEPKIQVVNTEFDIPYWGDHVANRDGECDVPWCKNSKPGHRHQNNYVKVKQELVVNRPRNELIAKYIIANEGHPQLVITSQTKQIDALLEVILEKGTPSENVYVITGKATARQRREIFSRLAEQDSWVLLSTVAGEALDVPKIDRIHLVFPTQNDRTVEQNIGRGGRVYEGKEDVIVFDYADTLMPVFAKQFNKRRWRCYERLELEVIGGNKVKKQSKGLGRLDRV